MTVRLASLAPIQTLAIRPYRLLWAATLLWNHTRWVDQYALGWLVLDVTNSAWHVALIGAIKSLPIMLFGVLGGAISDRVDRRRLLIVSQISGIAVAAALAAVIALGAFTVEIGAAIALLSGIQWALEWPARRALVPDLVGRERTVNAIALESVSMNLAKMMGPVVAGWLIFARGAEAAYAAVAVLFAAQIVLLRALARTAGGMVYRSPSMLAYLLEGWTQLRQSEPILAVLLITMVMNMFAFPYQTLMPVFARDTFGVDARGLGWLGGAVGSGSLIGSLYIASRVTVPRPGFWFSFGSIAMALSLVAFALSPGFAWALVFLFVSGFGQAGFSALQSTIILRAADESLRGRGMGALTVAIGMAPLGLLEIGWLATFIGAPLAVALNAGLCALLVLVVTLRFSGYRRLSH